MIKRITAVKGLGEWSAHMFLMFHLGRPDVLPVLDLGVRNGMRITYGLARRADTQGGAGHRRAVGAVSVGRVLVHVAGD